MRPPEPDALPSVSSEMDGPLSVQKSAGKEIFIFVALSISVSASAEFVIVIIIMYVFTSVI